MSKKIKILHLEDSINDSELIRSLIISGGIDFDYFLVENEKDFLKILEQEDISIIISDFSLPDYSGKEALKLAQEKYSDIPFIFVSGTIGEDAAITAMLNGATDYVLKNKIERLVPAIKRALHEHELEIKHTHTLKELKESEKKYRSIFENVQDVYYEVSIDETLLEVSPSIEILSKGGYRRENLIGKSMYDFYFFPGGREAFLELLQKQGTVADYEVILKNFDGSNVSCSISAKIQFDANHIPLKIIGSIRDISERKKLETNLLTATEIAKLGYWEFDVKSGNFIFNEQYYRLIHGSSTDKQGGNRMSAEEFTKRLIHPDDAKTIGVKLQEAISSPNPKYSGQTEARVFRDNGDITNVMIQFKLIKDRFGNTLKVFGINQDITQQKHFELELIRAKEKAEESDRLKSAFLANMSHEIRTPMNGILGFTGLLKEPKLSGEEQQAFIDIIEKSGARMLNIINDIINFSRIESGQVELSVSDVNIKDLTRDIFEFFKPEAEKKELNFSYKNILSARDVITKTDMEKLYAVLTNLVKNALKFTQTGSIELGYEKKDKLIEFFIKDTGIGIPKEQKEIIFERFRQGSESLTRNYEGAGLGLAISKAYVEMLGGKIWIESKIGQGSTFRFTIPYLNGMDEKKRLPYIIKNEIDQPEKFKILVADDDETSRMLLKIIVKPLASDILQSITGKEAVEICRLNPDIDLVLMDIQMPDMDGYEATRQIRKFNKDVVIIAQTAYALAGDGEKAIEAGCNDHISKPLHQAKLLKMIEKKLRPENV